LCGARARDEHHRREAKRAEGRREARHRDRLFQIDADVIVNRRPLKCIPCSALPRRRLRLPRKIPARDIARTGISWL
jgi:hypothetical protein